MVPLKMIDEFSEILSLNISGTSCAVAGIVAITVVIAKLSQGPNLDAIPTAGSSTRLGAFWDGLRFVANAQKVIQQGYDKYGSTPFKVAGPSRWMVILSDPGHLEEVAKASGDSFSLLEALNNQVQVEHTLGPDIHHNPYHVTVIRQHLNRITDALYPAMRDEIVTSFSETLDLTGNEWTTVPASSVIQKIVCRISNRVFIGLPLCRDPDWIDLNIQYTVHVVSGGVIVGCFPKSVRSLAARFLTKVPQSLARGVKLLGPIIEERLKYLDEYGTGWEDKPNDLLSWLMDEADGPELTAQRLTHRVLLVNFAAIHTTAGSFVQALFYLAAHPQYIQPLREEVEGIIDEDGWSRTALGKMHKVNSFLKECQRMDGLNIVTLSRKAMKDYTFSDRTFIPKGTFIAAATLPLHHDKNLYDAPEVFNPFRFVETHGGEDDDGSKHQFASTSIKYLAFGLGRYACPGRFLAASELGLMLAHVVVTYDVKLEDGTTYPPSWHFGTFIVANPLAKILFRKRVQ